MMHGTKEYPSTTYEARVPLEKGDATAQQDADIFPAFSPLKQQSDSLEDLLSCIEKWQNSTVAGSVNSQGSMNNDNQIPAVGVDDDEAQDGLFPVSMVSPSPKVHHSYMLAAKHQPKQNQGCTLYAAIPPMQSTDQVILQKNPKQVQPENTKLPYKRSEPLPSKTDTAEEKISEEHKLAPDEHQLEMESKSKIDIQSLPENEILPKGDLMKLSLPIQHPVQYKEQCHLMLSTEGRPGHGLQEPLYAPPPSVQQLQRHFQLQALIAAEQQSRSKDVKKVGAAQPGPLQLPISRKRQICPTDIPQNKRVVYRKVSGGRARAILTPLYKDTPSHIKDSTHAISYGNPHFGEDLEWEHLSSLNNTLRSQDGHSTYTNTIQNNGTTSTPWLYPEDGLLDGKSSLVYLDSLEKLDEERLSDSEENPLLHHTTAECNPLITPDDILIYGRRGSIHHADGPFLSNSDPQASRILKDVSINCQVNHIRALGGRVRRAPKERVPQQHNVEVYAQMAAEFEKIRGVCYCRSDNSWTAWWTDRGRNRKKAFKVSRFGFNEARRMAIEHRQSIYQKSLIPVDKRLTKDIGSEETLGSVGDATPRQEPYEYPNSLTNSPISSPIKSSFSPSRMKTRGVRTRPYAHTNTIPMLSTLSESKLEVQSTDEFDVNDMVTPRLETTSELESLDNSPSRNLNKLQTPILSNEDVKCDSSRSNTTDGRNDDGTIAHTTVQSPEYGPCNMLPSKSTFSLNSELLDLMKLDQVSRTSLETALSNLACGAGTTRLSTGETVQVLPQLAAEGKNVTVILITHPEKQGCP
ncbi:AP2 domain transcription factor AP2VIIa-4 [Babesia ovis]|uniref:AP2 domain transcription factor AP2VIIa-4 n=1 Tax=Babesia ovis TaxID=5869 RepID=A0A9W5TBV3_BABOV|nr:AP2 domain transcription factor AP2VIIa-4 [Babesia ovis]